MNRRGRAVGFLVGALLAAAAAAAIADGYGKSVVRGYGELRQVLVAAKPLAAGEEIDPRDATDKLEVRRVPVRFVPPDALGSPPEAIGLAPVGRVLAGSYLLASQLRPPRAAHAGTRLEGGRRPVEIAVSGAGALTALGAQPAGARVDVIVTTEPSGSGNGRTYVAAPGVPLLGLGPGGEGAEGETATATLALTRPQALRLIAAESFARRVTVIPASR
jgi:Flp pilus assembly protein CpaB